MKAKIIAAGAVVLLALTPAWAADVAGKWTAHVAAAQGQGDSDITFVFKVADGKLTGTLNNSLQPGDVEIKDGKVSGDEVSFSLIRNLQGTDMTVTWKGTISGDEIKFTRTQGGAGGQRGAGAAAGRGGPAAPGGQAAPGAPAAAGAQAAPGTQAAPGGPATPGAPAAPGGARGGAAAATEIVAKRAK